MSLWEHTSGAIARPADAVAAIEWAKKDRKALTIIRLRVSNNMMTHVISAATSKEAFDALSNVFNTEGTMARVTVRRRLFRYSIEEGAEMEEELRKIKALWQEHQLMGSTNAAGVAAGTSLLTDNDLAMVMLTALPPTWDPFISSITGLSVLSSADVTGRVLQEDNRRKDRSSSETSLVATSKSRTQKTKFRAGVVCHNCGKEGHIRPDCRAPKSRGRDRKSVTAYYAQDDSDSDAASDEEPDEYTFTAFDGAPDVESFITTEEIWLGDSATQSHIVRD